MEELSTGLSKGELLYACLNQAMSEQFPERNYFTPTWQEMDHWEKPAWERASEYYDKGRITGTPPASDI